MSCQQGLLHAHTTSSLLADSTGVIFKVGSDKKVKWIMDTQKFYNNSEDDGDIDAQQPKYEVGKWHDIQNTADGVALFNDMVSDAETVIVPMIVIKGRNDADVEAIKNDTAVQTFVDVTSGYFLNLCIDNYNDGIGKAYKEFWTSSTRSSSSPQEGRIVMPMWEDQPLPQILVYKACGHGSMDGTAAIYYVDSFKTAGLSGQDIVDKIKATMGDEDGE